MAGYAVEVRAEADGACELVERARPDLVILGLLFAGEGSGWAILERLKAHPATATIRVLVCSGSDRALRAGRELLDRHAVPVLVRPATVAGIAYAGDCGVERVEFSADSGETRTIAELLEPTPGRDAWVRRQGHFTLAPKAELTLVARATDGTGALQT